MKLKTKKQQNQLQILKLSYKKKSFNSKDKIITAQILLTKILKIIHEYNIKNKKILFIGFPKLPDKEFQNTKHLQIPELMINEIWKNPKSKNKTEQPSNLNKLTENLKKKADLIVINNLKANPLLINKNYLNHTPTIFINKKLQISNNNNNYNFQIQKCLNTNLFFSIIKILIKLKKENYFWKLLPPFPPTKNIKPS